MITDSTKILRAACRLEELANTDYKNTETEEALLAGAALLRGRYSILKKIDKVGAK